MFMSGLEEHLMFLSPITSPQTYQAVQKEGFSAAAAVQGSAVRSEVPAF